MSAEPYVTSEIRDQVAWLVLNRPSQLNVMTRGLLEALCAELESAAGDDAVRAVVLTGAGRAFSAGGNLRESLTEITGDGPVETQVSELRRFMRSSQLLAEMPKPTIAAVNGVVAGGSLGTGMRR